MVSKLDLITLQSYEQFESWLSGERGVFHYTKDDFSEWLENNCFNDSTQEETEDYKKLVEKNMQLLLKELKQRETGIKITQLLSTEVEGMPVAEVFTKYVRHTTSTNKLGRIL